MKQLSKAAAQRQRIEEAVWYEVKITGWSWPYSFGVKEESTGESHTEYRLLNIRGLLLEPRHLKTRSVRLIIAPRRHLNQTERNSRNRPTSVGDLYVQTGELEGMLFIPEEVLLPLMTAIAGGGVRYISLEGAKLRGRQCAIRYFSFDLTSDDDLDDRDIGVNSGS